MVLVYARCAGAGSGCGSFWDLRRSRSLVLIPARLSPSAGRAAGFWFPCVVAKPAGQPTGARNNSRQRATLIILNGIAQCMISSSYVRGGLLPALPTS
jgi:hypothetical protein